MESVGHSLFGAISKIKSTLEVSQEQDSQRNVNCKPIKVSQWELKIMCVLIGSRMYGLELKDAIQEKYEETISEGTLYTTLNRMLKKGFLEADWGGASEPCHGARRKFYTVASDGVVALQSVQALPNAIKRYRSSEVGAF
jgi:PadR family transcriptional regulator, regulatory protein PadR